MTTQRMRPQRVMTSRHARYELDPELVHVVWEGLREALPDIFRTLYAWFKHPSPRQRKSIVLNPSFSGTVVGKLTAGLKVEKHPRMETVAGAL